MNKQELIDKIADKTKLTKKDIGAVVDAMMKTIMDTVKKGQHVTLVGFGSFKSVKRAARKGRNPQTGKEIQIKARKAPKFTPGKLFKEKVK